MRDSNGALPLLEQGYTLYYKQLRRCVPALDAAAKRLAKELGAFERCVECEVFLSNAGSGAGMHADYDINLNIQLRGRKQWRIAPNRHVKNPPSMCLPARQIDSKAQADVAEKRFPSEMPPEAVRVNTSPGSVVFIPRGYWHETLCEEDSLAVVFAIKGPDFAQLFGQVLLERLRRSPDWRQFAVGPAQTARRLDLERNLRVLLDEVAEALSTITVDDLLCLDGTQD